MELDSDNPTALILKADSLSLQKRYGESIEWYNKILENEPDNVNALVGKGMSLGAIYKNEEAIEVLNKALNLEPDNTDALFFKGNALVNQKDKEAIKYFDRVLELDPNYPYVLDVKENAIKLIESYYTFLSMADETLEKYPNDYRVLYMKGIFFLSAHQYEKSIEVFDRVLELKPDHEQAIESKKIALEKFEEQQKY